MKTLISKIVFLFILVTPFSVHAGELTVIDPWVRAAPPNAPALAAFMTLENPTDSALSIIEVRTTLKLDHVELHRTQMADGMMKMIPQKVIPVAAHSSTVLKPGSWHIMLIKPVTVPKPGDSVQLTLVLNNGSEQTIIASVRKGSKMMHGSHNHSKSHE